MLVGRWLPKAEGEGNHIQWKGTSCLWCFCLQPERSPGWFWHRHQGLGSQEGTVLASIFLRIDLSQRL